MANKNDSDIIKGMEKCTGESVGRYFALHADDFQDDSTYWNVLGTLWKLGGTVIQQEMWKVLFSSTRRNRHKIMKTSERRKWRKLPKKVRAYRAVNNEDEYHKAISWTLSRSVALKLARGREIKEKVFHRRDVFAYFDRRGEDEILVNVL